jgi:hypothetical protein
MTCSVQHDRVQWAPGVPRCLKCAEDLVFIRDLAPDETSPYGIVATDGGRLDRVDE